jgi:hypothetical protein
MLSPKNTHTENERNGQGEFFLPEILYERGFHALFSEKVTRRHSPFEFQVIYLRGYWFGMVLAFASGVRT